jgi:predicted DNA-binding transcriptional regulator AlpA
VLQHRRGHLLIIKIHHELGGQQVLCSIVASDQLMGIAEIADLLGISTQRVDQLARQGAFPRPIAELRAGRIWRQRDVELWARRAGRIE